MKSLKALFTPNFLKKIDHYLLLRYPVLWSTKVHFFVFYSLILTNLVAVLGGLTYPLATNRIPDYNDTFQIWTWSFGLAVGILLYYAYTQSYSFRQIFSLKEVLLRTLVYLFCTGSLFVNSWIFPQMIYYRVTQIVPKSEFYEDLNSFVLEDYLAKMVQLSYYNRSYDHLENYWESDIYESRVYEMEDTLYARKLQKMVRYPKYQHILLESWLNRDKTVEKYFALCRTLDSLLPKPSREEMQNYLNRKMELEMKINTPQRMNQGLEPVKLRYWEVYKHLNPYKKHVIEFIRKHPDWQPEFKKDLLQKIKGLDEFIFSLEEDFGYYASLSMQSEKVIALQKKYTPQYNPNQSSLYELDHAFHNIFFYQNRDFFFQSLHHDHDFSSRTFFQRIRGENILSEMRSKGSHRMPLQFDPFTGQYWTNYIPDQLEDSKKYTRDIDLILKTKAFKYYLDRWEINKILSEELPQEISLPGHHLPEAYLTLWLMLSLLMLIAHTLSIPRFALISALCIAFYKLLQVFLFAYINLHGFGEDMHIPWASYFGFFVPLLLIFLSLTGIFYYRFITGNHRWLYWVFGLVSVTTLWAGLWIFAEMLDTHISANNAWALKSTIYLYLMLFVCNLILYWRYILVQNYPKINL
ncbi:MAG: hypothetical protein NW226_22275 [Microscillaceae bacterium]|nr:hypothetical protein [Microscillaceae bacterium]